MEISRQYSQKHTKMVNKGASYYVRAADGFIVFTANYCLAHSS